MKFVSHMHSTHSFDGKLALTEVHQMLRSHGIGAALMSEHIEELELADIRRFSEECRQVSTPDCVLIPGIEMDELHILIFGIGEVDEYESVLDLAMQCHERGALIAISHPLKLRSELAPEVMQMVEAVEVWNQRYDGRVSPRWKSVELFRRLQVDFPGRQMAALSGLDFHSSSDFADIYMEAEDCGPERESVLAAIRAGRHRIVRAGRAVEIAQTGKSSVKARLLSKAATAVRDSSVFFYRKIKGSGIRVPNRIRIAVKKVL
ncbi:MAG: hypothetical protein ABI383_13225 [Acidobacteriaceae bacterium]